MRLQQGQTLQNRYRIVKLIGQGGFGAVYRAWDTSLKQPVAVKENLDTSQEAQRQFEREARLMAGLRHSNLPRVTDHFLIPGQGQYLVMDFIEGQNLEAMLGLQGRPFTEPEILPWIEQVCSALTYLHSRTPPIIHRDIKPQNIIITPAGQAMLVDFGISKIYDTNLRTTVGAKAVTPGYSPPEQYGGDVTDDRADIYALGATLYYLLTGEHPPESVLRVAGSASLTPPRRFNAGISAGMEYLILKATDVTTRRRFQSVAELQKHLKAKQRPIVAYIRPALILLIVILLLLGGRTLLMADRGTEVVVANPTTVAATLASTPSLPLPTLSRTPPGSTPLPAFVDPSPSVTDTAVPSVTPSPLRTATLTRTPTSSRTPTRQPPSSLTPTPTATRQSAVAGRGLPLDFENFGSWARGDEQNGAFTQSSEQAYSGRFSGKLSYDFRGAGNDYVVFLQTNDVAGTPNALQAWVYGDGSGHFLNAWIVDAGGQTWQVPLGRVSHTGWRQMTGYILVGQNWPWTHISGPKNDQIEYPIRFRALVLDDYTDAYVGEGVIYIDEVTATTVPNPVIGTTPAAPTVTPGGSGITTPVPASPTPVSIIPPGNLGRILYTSGNIILTTDPDWNAPLEIGTAAANSCGAMASTVTGQTFNLFRGHFCAIGGTIFTCRAPNGQHEVLVHTIDAQTVSINIRAAGNTESGTFIYQGTIDRSEGIRWSPLSNSFLFAVGDTVHQAFPDGGYNQIIPVAYEPLFSPDGNYILYRKPVGPGINDIFVSNADGTNQRNVTNVQAIDKRCAAWRQ
jgi:serine/threonine protein kinase